MYLRRLSPLPRVTSQSCLSKSEVVPVTSATRSRERAQHRWQRAGLVTSSFRRRDRRRDYAIPSKEGGSLKVKRVVMGEPESFVSKFSHVEDVAPLDGYSIWPVWGWDELPRLPLHVTAPYVPRSYFPPPGGVRIEAVDYGPRPASEGASPGAAASMDEFMSQVAAGRREVGELHRTDTIDIGVVISGELVCEATDGRLVSLGPGDVYIQNGALHGWRSNPSNPAQVVYVLIGVNRDPDADRAIGPGPI
jgi:hypothetical protein